MVSSPVSCISVSWIVIEDDSWLLKARSVRIASEIIIGCLVWSGKRNGGRESSRGRCETVRMTVRPQGCTQPTYVCITPGSCDDFYWKGKEYT